ncbi:NAD-dependent epimerase/dehydratase family protein [Streptomyces sp. NPDC050504]|uniref:NAD-dependent epimerase/dehydratase family protein n=1 Tax=Streptomyces sp. NPDC050504 TaxID=3365618 RepID=UPI0037A0FF35
MDTPTAPGPDRTAQDTPCVAVIGGTGFIGRHLCTAFSRRGYRVLAVARRPPREPLPAEFTALDVLSATARQLTALLDAAGVRVVVNAATDSWDGTDEDMVRSHTDLVDTLVRALAGMARRPRLVHLGSVHEYGEFPYGVSVTEDRPPAPVTLYGRTKLAGTRTVLDAALAGRVDALVLRITNVCGPGTPRGSFLGKVADLLRAAAPDAPARLTVADARRDFVDVRDVADAVVRAAESPLSGTTLNIGQGTAVEVREILDLLVTASAVPPELVHRQEGAVRSNGANWTRADVGRAREALGWSPRIPLERSITDQWKAAAAEDPHR